MLPQSYYQNALIGGTDDGGGDKDAPTKISPSNPSPNFTYTKDPNVVIGKNGVKITTADMADADKNGMNWKGNFGEFAHWLGGFAHKPVDYGSVSPYYRTYPNGKINGADIAILKSKGDPKIDAVLSRNIAGPGEVPMYGPDDSDAIKGLVAAHKSGMGNIDYSSLLKNSTK